MRIGFSTSVIQHGRTGIGGYLFALTEALVAVGPQHEFILFVLEEDLPLFSFLDGRAKIVPVSERYRSPLRDIYWHQYNLPQLVREHDLDVLHVPSYRRLLWPKPCPLVATVHDLAAFHVQNKYDQKRMFYGRVVARWLAHRQDAIIAISHTTAKDIARFWKLPTNRVTIVHHGIDHHRFSPAPSETSRITGRKRFGLEQPFFLNVARLEHPAKNHLRLIRAFEVFKAETRLPWQLVFAGSDWHGADVIHACIRQSSCAADIRCLGFVPEADLPFLYRAAEGFVFPSLYEGFGFPPLEAMACGCPVICSARGALGEVVDHAALIVDPEDVQKMADGLRRVATEESVRRQLRQAGLARAAQFNWKHTAEQTLEVYERVTNSSNTPQLARSAK